MKVIKNKKQKSTKPKEIIAALKKHIKMIESMKKLGASDTEIAKSLQIEEDDISLV